VTWLDHTLFAGGIVHCLRDFFAKEKGFKKLGLLGSLKDLPWELSKSLVGRGFSHDIDPEKESGFSR